jgi:hypothetical protein
MVANHSAVEAREHEETFVATCSWPSLRERVPLAWPTPAGTPPSPKKGYRSAYRYLGAGDLDQATSWEELEPFDLVLRLIDFCGLRPVLAQLLGWTSARGQIPFDPVSLFLLLGWQICNGWSRSQTLRNLRKRRYADYRRRFGFHPSLYPSEGGLRYFLTTLGRNSDARGETIRVIDDDQKAEEVAVEWLNHLIAQSVQLILQAGILSDQAWKQALLCPDGMLHEAASSLCCTAVTESCYQPTAPHAPRPCPAREKERRGCDCTTLACQAVCRHAPVRDPEARFVWYEGSNQPKHSPNQRLKEQEKSQKQRNKGKAIYGYRSLPLQLADSQRRFGIVLLDDFLPANAREEVPATAQLKQVQHFYPDLQVDAVAGDAGLGYDCFLSTIYDDLGARRVVDLRSHQTDRDQTLWTQRHYDDCGRPICPFGYAFTANGFDVRRQRYKWFCNQACRQGVDPLVTLPQTTYPPEECPFLADDQPRGQIINVAKCFADGSIRLVRDVPFQSLAWKRLYHRVRNAVEGRNAAFKRWRLKRLPVYGQARGKALIFLADVWLNLTTLARLIAEATTAAQHFT